MKTTRSMIWALALTAAICPASGIAAELDVGLTFSEGVTNAKSADVRMSAGKNDFTVWGKFKYEKTEGNVSENCGSMRFGYDPEITKRWSLWFFEQPGYDEKQELDMENFAGGGPKYVLTNAENFRSSLSAGLIQHHAKYKDGTTTNIARLSTRSKLSWKISEDLSFVFVAFYQPNVETFKDYLINGETSLKYSFTERIGLKLRIDDSYRSVSKIDENNDFNTVLAVSINF